MFPKTKFSTTNESGMRDLHARKYGIQCCNADFFRAMTTVMDAGRKGAYMIDRYFVIGGRVMKYLSLQHNYQIRFCHKDSVLRFTKAVHERPVLAPGVTAEVLEGGYQYLPMMDTPDDLRRKYLRYLDLENSHLALGWFRWIVYAVKRLAIMVMLMARMVWIRMIHDPRDCLPVQYDMLSVWYGWQLIRRSCPLGRNL